jgi:hypothetical protein
MPTGDVEPSSPLHWANRRGLSTSTAAMVMIIVIVVVGGLGYVGLSATSHTGTATNSTCSPPSAPQCVSSSPTHDVTLFVPYIAGAGQNLLQVTQGSSIPATVGVTGSEEVNSYSVNWGDGTTSTGTNPTVTHSYTTLGSYILSATTLVGSTMHDGPSQLYPIQVTPSIGDDNLGYFPTLTATLRNGSSTTGYQFGWLAGSGTVTVSATIADAPLNPDYSAGTPSLTSTGGTQSGLVANATSASATYTFSNTGSVVSINTITFVVPINGPTPGLYGNYTWTVVVTPVGLIPGCARCVVSHASSPHPGTIDNYEVAPGGAESLDPSVDYDTNGLEVILNVYQTLINYNGSATGPGYVYYQPQAATCVPGSPQCASLYDGATLQSGNHYTFVINPTSRFYDPTTGKSWPVYPSDVVFTLARTMGFSLLPGYGANNGWIITQSLLPGGNGEWDGGIHGTFNNTPGPILSSMFVNDTSASLGSAACPVSALDGSGCVTFNATGGGTSWPFFLELIVDPLGSSIEPCGWFTAQGAGVPGFTPSKGADSPCLLPGGAKSTSDAAFQTYLASAYANPTEWDAFELAAVDSPGVNPGVQWNSVGSGPYYLVPNSASSALGYTLKANPAYGAPTCAGQPGCEPLPGQYASTVNTFWELGDQIGYEQYVAGYADFAGFLTPDLGTFLNLVSAGKIGLLTVPTLNIFFFLFNFEFDASAVATALNVAVNVPSDFFANVGVRNFLATSYPYTTIENTVNTVDGIELGFNYGGMIPQYMAGYPQNITWPTGNPVSSPTAVGSAGWWWAQLTTKGSLYYDSEVASCTASSPCIFPIVGWKGEPTVDETIFDWTSSIVALTGGALSPDAVDLTVAQEVAYAFGSEPSANPLPVYPSGWTPDYPDPTDYLAWMYYPDSAFTFSSALQETLDGTYATPTTYNASWCGHYQDSWANLIYWAGGGPSNASGYLPNACQYTAYQIMSYFMIDVAGADLNLVERNLIYNLVEHIAAQMGLYLYGYQAQGVGTYAPWINPATIDLNVSLSQDGVWWAVGGNGVW